MTLVQSIALARSALAEGRSEDVVRMLEPLVQPVLDRTSVAMEEEQVILRSLLASIRLLRFGDPSRARLLIRPVEDEGFRMRLTPAVRAEATLWLGWLYAWPDEEIFDDGRALHLLGEAEGLFRETMNTEGRAWSLLGSAWAYYGIDEYPLMRGTLQDAAALPGRDARLALWTLDLHTVLRRVEGHYADALTLHEALKLHADRQQDDYARGRARAYEAALFADLGRDPMLIASHAAEARTALLHAVVRPGPALLHALHAELLAAMRGGLWEQAEALLDESSRMVACLPAGNARWHVFRASLALNRGNPPGAAASLEALRSLSPHPRHRLLTADTALSRADLADTRQDLEAAIHWAAYAWRCACETGHAGRQLDALLSLVRLHLERSDVEQARQYLARTTAFRDTFSVLPVAAQRFRTLAHLALAENNLPEARTHLLQARSACSLIGDVPGAALIEAAFAALAEHEDAPLPALRGGETAPRIDVPATTHPPHVQATTPPPRIISWDTAGGNALGAALARASFSVPLVAETWLSAAARLLPDRWLGVYRCDEGQPWSTIREYGGTSPSPPQVPEPCGAALWVDRVYWLRLRSHPGPAFFFGVALEQEDDPVWRDALSRFSPWLPVVSLALDHALLRSEGTDPAAPSLPAPSALPDEILTFASPAMDRLVERLYRLRASHSPVLLTGESGSGKEYVARAIHALSDRRNGPFQVVSCNDLSGPGAVPALFENRGRHPAATLLGSGGTLFLDRVDTLSSDAQRALLHLLGENGGTLSDPAPLRIADARIIATASTALPDAVRDGRFSEALFYRLSVITLNVPPLRERREDIPLLARLFANKLCPAGMPAPSFTPRALERLVAYSWPGNVRQLRNEIERVLHALRAEPAPVIDLPDLNQTLDSPDDPPPVKPAFVRSAEDSILKPGLDLDQVMARTEKILVERVLAEHEGQVTASAQALGLTRQGLYKKMKRLDIDAARFHAPDATP